MLKKFIKISGTGKFLNYTASVVPSPYKTTDFEKINLIYGENGSGKTTLAIVLRSLKNSDSLLPKKRSFDKSFNQIIEVLTDSPSNPRHTYSNNAWDHHYSNLEIFDIHFINENIFTGLEIQSIHKKNLFEVIFGQKGIQLKKEIQRLKERIQTGNSLVRNTTEQIETLISKAYTAERYCSIQADPQIDTKISAKEAEITTAKSSQEIQAKNLLSRLPSFSLPFEITTATDALNKSITNISEDYLAKYNQHKSHLSMNGNEEEWLKQGFEAITDDSCPFCLRHFDDATKDIIEAYSQYFNVEYNNLVQELNSLNSSITSFNIENQLLQIENKITQNINLIDFWKVHLPNEPTLSSILGQLSQLESSFSSVKTSFSEKLANPIQAKDHTSLTAFESIVSALNSQLDTFNTAIDSYNSEISTLKALSTLSVPQLELELKQLKAVKIRPEAQTATLCDNFTKYNNLLGILNQRKNNKQIRLDNYSASIFLSYTTAINKYLKVFAPYLEIRNLDSGYVGSSRDPMVKYALHIDGNEVKLEDTTTDPSFKYSLSEGDKTALALSFFLSKLELDGNIQDKIIVFDDPVSSFDLNRKSATIFKLLDFGQQSKQLFVLTHNIIFAGEFWKSANQRALSNQCSKIEFLGNSSCIVEYNIDTDTLLSVLKDSKAIKTYLTTGCLSDAERRGIARCLRPALESYFNLKFFDVISPTDWLGDFIGKIRAANNPSDRFHRLQGSLNELSDINDYSKKYHHRFNSANESEPINDAELRNYCDRTLNVIELI